MPHWKRSWTVTAATVLAIAAIPGAILTVQPTGDANADVADAVAPYVPPPAYYAPMPYDPPPPPNVTGCVSYNGRWVNAAGCN
jgi:hypothetical protein